MDYLILGSKTLDIQIQIILIQINIFDQLIPELIGSGLTLVLHVTLAAQLTRDNGYRSAYLPKLLSGEVFDQAADQGALSHLRGADYDNHNWGRFQGSAVDYWDVMFFGLYVLGPEDKYTLMSSFTHSLHQY